MRLFFIISLIFEKSQIPNPVGIPQENPALKINIVSSLFILKIPVFIIKIKEIVMVVTAAMNVNSKECQNIKWASILVVAGCGFIFLNL